MEKADDIYYVIRFLVYREVLKNNRISVKKYIALGYFVFCIFCNHVGMILYKWRFKIWRITGKMQIYRLEKD